MLEEREFGKESKLKKNISAKHANSINNPNILRFLNPNFIIYILDF